MPAFSTAGAIGGHSVISYLIRTLLHRLGLTAPQHRHKLRVLASSASLPVDGPEAAASAQYLYEVKGSASRRGALPASIVTSLGVGVAKEVFDVVRPYGSGFSRRDLVWDALGTAAAAAVILL